MWLIHIHWQGNPGYLKYQDISTGQLVAEHRTKLGACATMTQNQHNAVIHLGHQNGTVTLWTPNLPHPAVRLLAHLGPVSGVSIDQSTGGRYMATAGVDGIVKLWDCRSWRDALRSWNSRGGHATLAWSQRGCLAVASGGAVNVGTIFFELHVIITPATLQGVFHAISSFPQSCALSTSIISNASPNCETPYFPRFLPISGCPCYWACFWHILHTGPRRW